MACLARALVTGGGHLACALLPRAAVSGERQRKGSRALFLSASLFPRVAVAYGHPGIKNTRE